ncbi:hypothetical protein GGR57DRAFT_456474 [Xylariaceae sp. FL1272]|nr:hypothetical protein GGR57DRAFT_456474 [Xylariaceae sp. FL1272]
MAASEWPRGANESFTAFFGVQLNLTTLNHWNYSFYEGNWTVSNISRCHLIDPPYTPVQLLDNGTFVNSTGCYNAIQPSGPRSNTGIGFAVGYGVSLIFVLVNLTRHGKLYLPATKRFYPIGRRWQWYWAIILCVFAFIGLITGVDIDRYRVVELPLILEVFFWFLMNMAALAMVWESVRHWGSWMERQFIDPNPFVLHQTDKRGMFEFWLPLFFYLWWWLSFFVIIPRNWGQIELQRSPSQLEQEARPSATDVRFKIAPFFLFVGWLTILVSLWHSIRHYEERNRGWLNRITGFFNYVPIRFLLMLPISLGGIAYQALSAWDFDVSPLKDRTNLVALYVGGYVPSLLLILIQCAAGFLRPNEDKELIRQRRERGNQLDQELGITHKPAWWRRMNGNQGPQNMGDQVLRNVQEVTGRRERAAVAERRAAHAEATEADNSGGNNNSIEMSSIPRTTSLAGRGSAPPPYAPPAYTGRSDRRRNERTQEMVASLLFPHANNTTPVEQRGRESEAAPSSTLRPAANLRTPSTASGVSMSGPPQQIRSMLDV